MRVQSDNDTTKQGTKWKYGNCTETMEEREGTVAHNT